MKFGWLTLAHSPSPEHDAQAIFEQLEQATLCQIGGWGRCTGAGRSSGRRTAKYLPW